MSGRLRRSKGASRIPTPSAVFPAFSSCSATIERNDPNLRAIAHTLRTAVVATGAIYEVQLVCWGEGDYQLLLWLRVGERGT
eukprot:933389-Prymnesium_polylepis.1